MTARAAVWLPMAVLSQTLHACDRGQKPRLVSPSDGAIVRAPWVPLSVFLPPELGLAEVEVQLDGAPWRDPLALTRARGGVSAPGADHLATLDMRPLTTGPHQLDLTVTDAQGARHRLRSTFTVAREGAPLRLRLRDGRGEAVPGRVLIWDARGAPWSLDGPDAGAVDPLSRDVGASTLLLPTGEGELWLPPGVWRVVAWRGLRAAAAEVQVVLGEAGATLDLDLPELVPTPGWLAADLHVHSGASGDSYVPTAARLWSLATSGLDAFVLTDHQLVGSPAEALALLGGGLLGLPGVELQVGETRPSKGHLNAFPLAPGPRPVATAETPGPLLAALRAEAGGGPLLVQLNHPRGIQFRPTDPPQPGAHALFNALGYDRAQPPGVGPNAWMTPDALGFDAVEVLNRFSWPLYREARADWLALWAHGHPRTATGNSDSHGWVLDAAGLPLNLVRCPRPAPGEPLDAATFVEAVAQGALVVSNGPVLELVARAAGREAGPGELLSASEGRVELTLSVRAAPWVPVPEARLLVDGKVHEVVNIDVAGAVQRAERSWTLTLARDAWILAEAGWPLSDEAPAPGGLYAELAPGHVPIGFTNPIRVDVDGDGAWTPGPQ